MSRLAFLVVVAAAAAAGYALGATRPERVRLIEKPPLPGLVVPGENWPAVTREAIVYRFPRPNRG